MKNNAGFTMIEMMLSMAFVAFLMVTIAMTTISMGQTYEKGLTLNSVNESGRAIISDMQSTIQQSSGGIKTKPVGTTGGFICFGNFTYAYNTGAALAAGGSSLLKYSDGPLRAQPVHLAKIPDAGGSYCSGTALIMGATELLPTGDRNLAIQSMTDPNILNRNNDTLQTLYQISFVLGTNNQAAYLAGNCSPPSAANSDTNYCAVNTFNFIVRAGGSK